MRLFFRFATLTTSLMLSACAHKGTNSIDPYEPMNRKVHKFNMALDSIALKPAAKLYKTVLPGKIRLGVNNFFNNIIMIPTAANDVLQGDWRYAIKDSWRFLINSTLGVAGFFDVANKAFSLPPHYNDLGLTFAKWGDKKSPYIVLPFLGPSTIRDGMALPFDYLLTPYPYVPGAATLTAIAAVRYVDLRSQLLESDRYLDEALDKYSFIRDAYLQHRNYLINGEQQPNANESGYVEEGSVGGYIDEEPAKPQQPLEKK